MGCSWAEQSRDQVPLEVRFSTPLQTGPGTHPASYIVGARSFPLVKRPGHGINHTLPPGIEVKDRVELTQHSQIYTFIYSNKPINLSSPQMSN